MIPGHPWHVNNADGKQSMINPKMKRTGKGLYTEFVKLGHKYRRLQRGTRDQLYFNIARAAKSLDLMKTDIKLRKGFLRELRRRKIITEPDKNIQLPLEMMVLLRGARGREARKKASKYALALSLLRSENIPANRIATEMRKRGGLEKILSSRKLSRKSFIAAPPPIGATSSASNADVEKQEPASEANAGTNNRAVEVIVTMKLADHDSILELPVGSRFCLEAMRIGQSKVELNIRRVKHLR